MGLCHSHCSHKLQSTWTQLCSTKCPSTHTKHPLQNPVDLPRTCCHETRFLHAYLIQWPPSGITNTTNPHRNPQQLCQHSDLDWWPHPSYLRPQICSTKLLPALLTLLCTRKIHRLKTLIPSTQTKMLKIFLLTPENLLNHLNKHREKYPIYAAINYIVATHSGYAMYQTYLKNWDHNP